MNLKVWHRYIRAWDTPNFMLPMLVLNNVYVESYARLTGTYLPWCRVPAVVNWCRGSLVIAPTWTHTIATFGTAAVNFFLR